MEPTTSAHGSVDANEAALLAEAQKGNLFAFEEIVKRYQRRVYAVAYRIVRRHDVADVVEDITSLKVAPNGDLYLIAYTDFSVPGISGLNEDVFVCTPVSLGD